MNPFRKVDQIHTGKPSLRDTSTASSSVVTSPDPGTMGTPESAASLRAVCLRPNSSMLSGDGPTKTIPARDTASANSTFSDKKP